MSLIKKQKDILSHDPLVSIFSNNDLLTISVDTDSEDLNRQPKNIKIPNADLKELTIQISGFDTLENNTVTIRHRDTTEQERVSVSDLVSWLQAKVS